MLVPEVKQLWGEDGRCKESQEEKAAYGQVLDVLPRNKAGESPAPPPQTPPLPCGNWGREAGAGSEGHPGPPRRLLLWGLGVFPLENDAIIPILHEQTQPTIPSPLRSLSHEGSVVIIPILQPRKQKLREANWLAQGHTADEQRRQDPIPDL